MYPWLHGISTLAAISLLKKWLKDRKGRALNFEDILHYQKIIHVLKSTAEIMQEIDGVRENF
jgi:hypothetical protein